MFKKRLGTHAKDRALLCPTGRSCPDILELETGDFAIIGKDITAEAMAHLPADTGCGNDERVVRIPRAVLVAARSEIPRRI